jgi:hypothetical protein
MGKQKWDVESFKFTVCTSALIAAVWQDLLLLNFIIMILKSIRLSIYNKTGKSTLHSAQKGLCYRNCRTDMIFHSLIRILSEQYWSVKFVNTSLLFA